MCAIYLHTSSWLPWVVSSNSPFYSTSDKRQGWLSPCTPTQPEKQVMEVTRGINSQACQLPWRAGCLRHARGSRSICSSGLHSATPQHFPSCTNHPAVGRQCRITKGQCWNTPGQRKNKTFQLLCNVMSHHVTFCCSNKVWWRDLWGLLCRPSKKTRTKLYNPQWASRLCLYRLHEGTLKSKSQCPGQLLQTSTCPCIWSVLVFASAWSKV